MRIFFLGFYLFLAGCATTAPQVTNLLENPGHHKNSARIEDVPFVQQDAGHCGPATLAMALGSLGHSASVDELAKKMMGGDTAGTLQESMIAAGRREGFMTVRIEGFSSLLDEVADSHPVIIFENLGLSWYQKWHYAIVTGYDLSKDFIQMHSGTTANERTPLRVFERSWKHSNYWGLVMLRPGTVARSAGEVENLRAAAGLELAGRLPEAELSYEAIVREWPRSWAARIGLGNAAFQRRDFLLAIKHLKAALEIAPDSKQIRHNLAVAEQEASRTKKF